MPCQGRFGSVLRQQFECVSVTRAHYGEVAVVEGGDPAFAAALGEGDDGRVRSAEPQVGVGRDQLADALPVFYARAATSIWPSMIDS